MNIRQPFRAGSFYEGAAGPCRRHAVKLQEAAELPDDLPEPLYGGLVPHAGWAYSGPLAALTLKALATAGTPQTVVLFGSDHIGVAASGELYDSGVWRTPLGDAAIDEELAAALLAGCGNVRANPAAHDREHSLEIQVPLIQTILPAAKIVPLTVPPSPAAAQIGEAVGAVLAGIDRPVTIVGSTDLTHHGGHFGNWGGRHEEGVIWTERNDRRILDLIESMQAEQVVSEAAEHRNACGAGAIAAAVAACRKLGASRGICLAHTNSYRIVHERYPADLDDTTVGYASVVFA